MLGSLERWLAIALEHRGALPDWLAPVAVGVCPVGQAQEAAARDVVQRLRAEGVPAQLLINDPLGKRLRDLAERKVPVWAVVGAREAQAGEISVRRHDGAAMVLPTANWVEEMARSRRELSARYS